MCSAVRTGKFFALIDLAFVPLEVAEFYDIKDFIA